MDIKIFYCVVIGLVAGIIIGKFTEYFTSFDFGPVISIKDRGMTGPATVVIQGLGVGMISTVPPVIVLAVAIVSTSALGGPYGVAISAVGMLATLGITLATDAYGPVADNAGGLAELAYLGKEVRAITDSLDALGNTTAATGKGFAIGSAVLTALSLLSAFKDQIGERDYSIGEPIVLGGALVGAMLPYLFAALTMISVGKAAAEIIQEVRHQFATLRNADGFLLGDCIRLYTDMYEKHGEGNWRAGPEQEVYPDSDKCVVISTRSSVREMIAPGAYAVLAPLIGGFLVGPRFLIGLLAGAIASGCMLAIMMANAGGAWDNSKKLCEKLGLKKSKVSFVFSAAHPCPHPYPHPPPPPLVSVAPHTFASCHTRPSFAHVRPLLACLHIHARALPIHARVLTRMFCPFTPVFCPSRRFPPSLYTPLSF